MGKDVANSWYLTQNEKKCRTNYPKRAPSEKQTHLKPPRWMLPNSLIPRTNACREKALPVPREVPRQWQSWRSRGAPGSAATAEMLSLWKWLDFVILPASGHSAVLASRTAAPRGTCRPAKRRDAERRDARQAPRGQCTRLC